MIGSGEGNVVREELGKFLHKGRGELWTAVQDNLVIEAETSKNVFEKQGSNSGSINSFITRDENHPLSKPMVDHNQNRVKT